MAASTVKLSTAEKPGFYSELREDSAKKATELLQENHDIHHIFFNQEGFHNHIAHHLLSIYALGTDPATIEKQYVHNRDYQRPPSKLERSIVNDLHNPDRFKGYTGKQEYYTDFLVFFQQEMDKKGWEAVVNEYLFARDDRAEDLFVRLHAGFLHPLIHLGFGIEFKQPAIIAEALAQTAIHDTWIGDFLLPAEKKASPSESKTLVQLLDDIHADKVLSTAPHWDDSNKIRDGLLVRAPDRMLKYASQFTVKPEDLEERTAEMINAAIYYTSAAQRPPHEHKFDFYFMHCANASIFFPPLLEQSWLSTENKVRLLEWKGRMDLAMYASRRSPDLHLEDITEYIPKVPTPEGEDPWKALFDRISKYPDDGHAPKLVRAIANGEKICKPYEDKDAFRIKGDMWLKIAHMVVDSVEAGGQTWIRSAGFDEAWKNVGQRPLALL